MLFSFILLTGCAVVDESKVYSYEYKFMGVGLLVTNEINKKLESPEDPEFYTLTGPGSNMYYMDPEEPVRFTNSETDKTYIEYNTKMYSLESEYLSESDHLYRYYYKIYFNDQLQDYRLELINYASIGNAYGIGITEYVRTFNYYFNIEAEEQHTIFLERGKPLIKIVAREYDTSGKLMSENEYKDIAEYRIEHDRLELEFHETNLETDKVEIRTYDYLKSQTIKSGESMEDSPFGTDDFYIRYLVDDGKPYARIKNLRIK